MHSTDNLEDNYLGSGKILGYSRNKYGDENHVREILEYASDRKSLASREKEIVNGDLLKDPLNINLKYGGDGGGTKSIGAKSAATRRERGTGVIGSIKGEETKRKSGITLIAAAKGVETRRKRGTDLIGAAKAAETRRKNGTDFAGKKHSEETIQKMRDSCKGKRVGELNSQYGKVWISNESSVIKIKKDELQFYLDNGWIRGRKIISELKDIT
jgi:hypothetical protein